VNESSLDAATELFTDAAPTVYTLADRFPGMEYVTVQDTEIPAIGLGTWRMSGPTCRRAVATALDLGYRHIDTAQSYGNEAQVGAAIAKSGVEREELFLTTKLAGSNRDHDSVLESTHESLDKLNTDYVDLLLIHQPNTTTDLAETIGAMDELVENGVVEHIGVSNFGVERLHAAREHADTPILTNQVQYHPFWDQSTLLDYCQIHDLMLTAYSPLAHGGAVNDDHLRDIGARYDKTPAQVALRWLLQQENVSTIPKSTSPEHIEANLQVFDFELSSGEMRSIRQPSISRTASSFLRARLPF
jgi:diketogulonate reductase-like aldo/keto reductase